MLYMYLNCRFVEQNKTLPFKTLFKILMRKIKIFDLSLHLFDKWL